VIRAEKGDDIPDERVLEACDACQEWLKAKQQAARRKPAETAEEPEITAEAQGAPAEPAEEESGS
jgi:hypothetical protein